MTEKRNDGFTEQVGIQVFAATLFSYFLSNTLDWLSKNWTKQMYDISIWDIISICRIFIPVIIIFLADVGIFIKYMYRFWIIAQENPIKNERDAILQVFIILPIASWPWAVFHAFTPWMGDNELLMHVWFLCAWLGLFMLRWCLYNYIWKPVKK